MGNFKLGAAAALAATMFTGGAYAGGDIFVSGQAGAGEFSPAYGSIIWLLTGNEARPTRDLRGQVSGSYTFDNGFGAQGDLLGNSITISPGDSEIKKTTTDGALHAYYRQSDLYLLGGFAQFGRDTMHYAPDFAPEFDRSYAGVEGQLYLDNLTLNAQLGLAGFSIFDADGKGWFGTVEARYFVTPDFKVTASAGLFKLDFDTSQSSIAQKLTNLTVGIGAEYKLADLPLSLTANVDYGHSTTDLYDGEHNVTRALVGLKFALGEGTLLDRDRKGTTLNPIEPSEYLYTPPQ